MGFGLDRDTFNPARSRIDLVNRIIITAGKPEDISVDDDITHVRTAATRDRPVSGNFTCCKINDADAALPFRRTVYPGNTPIGDIQLLAVAARVKTVRA